MKAGRINIRTICRFILCVLMARVGFWGLYPIAVAVYVIVFSENRRRNPLMAAVISGLLSKTITGIAEGAAAVKYILIFLCISVINRLAVNRKIYIKRSTMAYISGIITAVLGICGSALAPGENIILSIGEGILVVVLVNLLYKGIHLCEYGKLRQELSDEQMISVVIMLTIALNGIPDMFPALLSIPAGLQYLLVLCISYRYGPAAGAIAGVAAGISAGLDIQSAAFIGLYCLVGVAAGTVRSAGKWASLFVYTVSGAIVALLYPDELWSMEQLRAFLSAAAGFICIPAQVFAASADGHDVENVLVRSTVQQETGRKLAEFAGAFERLGHVLEKNCSIEPVISTANVGEIFTELTHTVCGNCSNCSYCWEQRYYDTYHEALGMLGGAEENGHIRREDVSVEFASRCIHFDDFMRETNQQLEIARISTGWQNRFTLNRALVAEQMKEISGLINELESDVAGTRPVTLDEEAELVSLLRAFGLNIKKLAVVEKRNRTLEISIRAKTRRSCCVTMREIADMIGSVLGDRWKAADGAGTVFSKEYETVSFVQDVKYRILTGVARKARNGENISGDNYSFLTLSSGKVIMTITDGIGSGQPAYEESETVIEMLEQLIEAGFREETALRFINSTLMFTDKSDMFSTVDMCVIDLNTGVCECIKCGAAATFIKKNHCINVVHGDAVPVGIIPEAVPERSLHRLMQGEYVIMISDGISDSFMTDDKEEYVRMIIGQAGTDNPQEMADYILERAKENSGGVPNDDMSVIVAGLWNKL